MDEFKEFGRWVEEEAKRVKRVIEVEICPTAEKTFIEALRMTSAKLAKCAEKLEKRAQRASA